MAFSLWSPSKDQNSSNSCRKKNNLLLKRIGLSIKLFILPVLLEFWPFQIVFPSPCILAVAEVVPEILLLIFNSMQHTWPRICFSLKALETDSDCWTLLETCVSSYCGKQGFCRAGLVPNRSAKTFVGGLLIWFLFSLMLVHCTINTD